MFPSATAGHALRVALALTLCLGSAADRALALPALWLCGVSGHEVADQGYFHSHAPGEAAHWHPFLVSPSEATQDEPSKNARPLGFSSALGGEHTHATVVLPNGSPEPTSNASPPTEATPLSTECVSSRVAALPPVWKATGPRGPPLR